MIAIDLTFFDINEIREEKIVSGIGTWMAEFLDVLIATEQKHEFILIINFYAEKYICKRFPGFKIAKIGGFVSSFFLKYINKSTEIILKKIGYNSYVVNQYREIDAIWFPFAVPEIVYKCNCEIILTIHDFMTCKTIEEKKQFEKMIHLAKKIVVISEYIKKQFISMFPEEENKLSAIIPNSISPVKSITQKPKDVDKKFILDVNRYTEHKNPMTLLKAFEYYVNHTDDKNIKLVFCGFGDKEYLNKLKEYIYLKEWKDRVIFLWRIPIEEKNWLLKNAELFVTPSTNEGFGRTPLEAMMNHIPVISTKETSLQESTLNLVKYYDNPYDFVELGKLIINCLGSTKDKENLERISQKVKDTYAPERIVKCYSKLF